MNKKLIILLSALTLASGFADAALPQEGYYLDKDGAPLTEAQQIPPRLKTNKMAPMSKAVHDAMETLPASSSTVIEMTITEDGAPADSVVTKSAGSIILDEYAMDCVRDWTFVPARRGDKAVSAKVSLPIRFTSMMIVTPAAPLSQPMKEAPEETETAMERNNHPAISVSVYVKADGTPDGKPKAMENTMIAKEDFRLLSKYAENCVKDWTFTPATNPDGENIPQDLIVTVQL